MGISDDGRWIAPEPGAIARVLAEAGAGPVDPGALDILPRDERFAVRLPGDRMAWFPTSRPGLERLRRERRVLELIARHCSFAAPRVAGMLACLLSEVPGLDPLQAKALFHRLALPWSREMMAPNERA